MSSAPVISILKVPICLPPEDCHLLHPTMAHQSSRQHFHVYDWHGRTTHAIFLDAVLRRIYQSLFLSFAISCWVVPIQAAVEKHVSPEAACEIEFAAYVYFMVMLLEHNPPAVRCALYTPYLWWCGYATREKAVFAVSWYLGAAALPYLAGSYFRYILHKHMFHRGYGSWAVLWTLVIEGPILSAMGWLLSVAKLALHSNTNAGQFLSPVSWEYRNHFRRLHSKAVMSQPSNQRADDMEYIYDRVRSSSEIRLVQIQHRECTTADDITLVTKSLEETGLKYTAISYVWGDPRKTHDLRINGKWLSVPTSTFEIVQTQLQWWAVDSDRLFWIDSLCINQDNNEEKQDQMKLMRRIYSEADQVVSYLKPDDYTEADIAVTFFNSLLSDIANEKRRSYGLLGIPDRNQPGHPIISRLILNWSQATGQPASTGWEALSKLYAHRYWTRAWIVPELILAPQRTGALRIFYGEHELSWKSLHYFTLLQMLIPLDENINWNFHDLVSCEPLERSHWRLRSTFDLRLIYQDIAGKNDLEMFPALLTSCRQLQATNPLDRVFALLSVLRDGPTIPPELQPDYATKTARQLYTDLAIYCLRNFHLEWILVMAGVGYWPEKLAAPSWVPDWTQMHPIRTVVSEGGRLKWSRINYTLSSFRAPAMSSEIEVSSSLLRLRSSRLHIVGDTVSLDGVFNRVDINPKPGAWNKFLDAVTGILGLAQRTCKMNNVNEATVDAIGIAISLGSDSAIAFRHIYNDWVKLTENTVSRIIDQGQSTIVAELEAKEFERYTSTCELRALAMIDDGSGFALVPQLTQEGDEIHTIHGTQSHFILRPMMSKGTRHFKLVGDCFVSLVRGYARPRGKPAAMTSIELI